MLLIISFLRFWEMIKACHIVYHACYISLRVIGQRKLHSGAGRPNYPPATGGHADLGSNSRWTPGWSPTYMGQTNGSNRNFLDEQYIEDYSVPSEYDNAYAAGEQIGSAYGPYGYYGHQGVLVRYNTPALVRSSPRRLKLVDSPHGHLINDYYYGAMVGMSHQQAMNSDVVMRRYWDKMYRWGLMMTINNPIWWRNLIDSHAVVRRISQQQAMGEIEEMISRLNFTNNKILLTTGMKRKTEIQVVDEPKSSSSVLVNTKQQEVKSQAASLGDDKKKKKSFVVLDLKATCWDSEENKYRVLRQEIVELSSVLVDAATGHTKSTFHKYVIPTENHVLSEYCKKYNGIKQEAVERKNGALTLPEALKQHKDWIDEQVTNWNSAAVVVTWGNWDCRTMLKQECFRKNLEIPDYFARWINLKTPFADKYGNGYWKKSVKEALEATELLKWEGEIKGGESHAHNKARLLSSLIHRGANLAITSWLDPAAAAAAAARNN